MDILIPENAKKDREKNTYHDFYEFNINNDMPIIKPIDKVTDDIKEFLLKQKLPVIMNNRELI